MRRISDRVVEELPIVVEEPTPEGLTDKDTHRLGWVVGARYRIWTHEIDTVLGYTEAGVVVVRGADGRIRRHLTSAEMSKRVD